ncbi:MAG: TfoX/Sxy family DNA transformation protein [Paludibacter sp.]
MATSLVTLPNIGKDTASKLKQAGINSTEEFLAIGVEHAFLKLQALDPGACIQLLYGLEGAYEGIKDKELSPAKKLELLDFYRLAKH